jgi:hypothetical protein
MLSRACLRERAVVLRGQRLRYRAQDGVPSLPHFPDSVSLAIDQERRASILTGMAQGFRM